MNVVFLRSNPVLPDPRVEKEANTLVRLGYSVQIVAWNREEKNTEKKGVINLQNGKVPIRWLNIKSRYGSGMKSVFPLIAFQISLLYWLLRNHKKYEVIHACDFDTVLPAWLVTKLYKKKLVYDIFDYYIDAFKVPQRLMNIVEKIDIYMINNANAVIIVNESRLKQIEKSNPKKLYIIHNTPDYDLANNRSENVIKHKSKNIKFVYVGILSNNRFLKEITEIMIGRPDWELHIGGFGALDKYMEDMSQKHGNIYYYGKMPYEKVLNLELESDVMLAIYNPIYKNNQYSSPNKLYEAMLLGKPIIVANGTGVDELVESYNIGISVEYNRESFISLASELLNDNAKMKIMKENLENLYKNKYSWGIMSKRLEELYENL